MGIQKKFLKSKPVCKVTFIMPKEAVESAEKVNIVGDFNNWDKNSSPLKDHTGVNLRPCWTSSEKDRNSG